MTEPRTNPLYFFDQPTRRKRVRGPRANTLHVPTAADGAQLERGAPGGLLNKRREQLSERRTPVYRPGPPSGGSMDPLDAYKRAAPRLLNELARLLSQHKWTEKTCIPNGIVNFLNYSWQDLTAGAAVLRGQERPNRRRCGGGVQRPGGFPRNMSAAGRRGPRDRRNPQRPGAILPNPAGKKLQQKTRGVHTYSSINFSISSSNYNDPGMIILPKQFSYSEPHWISLCEWVVRRLQAAVRPEKQRNARNLRTVPLLCHYGEPKGKGEHRKGRRKGRPAILVNGIPQLPAMHQRDPMRPKLHYKIDDGSSVLYYPSGCVAVCQSYSGMSQGGFYTNVFGDSDYPVVMATMTAFGHGSVTLSLSSPFKAIWDQDGGFITDQNWNKVREWNWLPDSPKEKIVIQLSDVISVSLLSGTSAILNFRCCNESVQFPLPVLSNNYHAKEMGLEGPVTVWRKREPIPRDLRMLQQKVRNTVDRWLDFYRAAIGIKCPDRKRRPSTLPRTRRSAEPRSGSLPPPNPPETPEPFQPEESWSKLQQRGLSSAWSERAADSSVKLPRTPKPPEQESPVTWIGPIQIHGNIDRMSVTIPDQMPLWQSRFPGPPLLPPSVPLTVCPVLLRAALLGEAGHRQCGCSGTLMPAVTDLEYDTLVMGQPPHSKQILMVCVAQTKTQASPAIDTAEQLYRVKNKQRAMPCSQCQMDSFRLVRYEMSTGPPSCGYGNVLLQQRHNAAPGMFLMYIRGTLLFMDYICCGQSCTTKDLQKQISKTRGDYRLGRSLPADYMFSHVESSPVDTDSPSSREATPTEDKDEDTPPFSEEEAD